MKFKTTVNGKDYTNDLSGAIMEATASGIKEQVQQEYNKRIAHIRQKMESEPGTMTIKISFETGRIRVTFDYEGFSLELTEEIRKALDKA